MLGGDTSRFCEGVLRAVKQEVLSTGGETPPSERCPPMTQTTKPGICRICSAHCGVLATVTDGKLTKVTGDPDNPMFKGYTCNKGRALPEIHNNPLRLLHSQKRRPDGTHGRVAIEHAMDEIATRLDDLIKTHGPRSVALYLGTNGLPYPASPLMANAFIRAIESPMFFTANTIDQPGKQIALSAHGHWAGWRHRLQRRRYVDAGRDQPDRLQGDRCSRPESRPAGEGRQESRDEADRHRSAPIANGCACLDSHSATARRGRHDPGRDDQPHHRREPL